MNSTQDGLTVIHPTEVITRPTATVTQAQTRTGHTVGRLISSWLGQFTESAATREAYQKDLDEYIEWCTEHGLDPLAVMMPEVQMYAVDLAANGSRSKNDRWRGRPLSAKTRARKLSSVSSWYTYLTEVGAMDYSPATIKRPKYDRKHSPTSTFTEKQATAMLAAGRKAEHRTISAPCLALALSLLIDLGVRVTEVCNLNDGDLGQRDGVRMITVRMKGGKVRDRAIPPQVGATLDAYLETRPDAAEGHEGALLRSLKGRRLDRRQILYAVQRMAAQAGLPRPSKITPHSCRHAFNTIARERGAALEDRQEALGHSSASTTRIYDHVSGSLKRDPAFLVATATAAEE